MQQPTLIVLAAGMGSRFGGLKQIMAVDDSGHAIIDFSLYDAYRAGFRKVAFIIKHEIEEDFKAAVGRRMEKYFDVKYVYQQLDVLPDGCRVPEGRVKPWGTGHAVLCCRGVVDGPFAVINADDFYGPSAYRALYDFLAQDRPDNEHAMVAYLLRNTVTENGYVARGVCQVEDGFLTDVVERTHIEKRGTDAAYTEDGTNYISLPGDTLVSMNCWAFGRSMLDELYRRFPAWLEKNLADNPLKCEYFLPSVANAVIKNGEGSVCVLNCREKWYGMTYKEDMQSVTSSIRKLRCDGIYPEKLLD
ncbi:MAG: sugar phosphate nucleotidyltransferase [Candidatus Limivicinus sp.]|nr:sugar phosphate nucleotidyltransferase [Clostridiales bacterium]MDY3859317.1 sugar phosphate nucleotidyltransferase [Candidatus Limivicinus sp.]